MLNAEENEERSVKEILIEQFDFETCFEKIDEKYKKIFQIIIICLCFFSNNIIC